jgi:NAD(P)-dependent dehydrogenase (short-subunit alcohol dehydrogenase family)
MNNDTGTSLQGRTALITGGSSGVGRGIALAMADKGAAIAVAGRTMERCERVVAEIEGRGAKAIAIQCDVNDPDDVIRTVDTATTALGRLDCLVHSAQSFNYGPIRRLAPEDFDESWRTGPLAAVRLMQAAFPALRESKGLIVNVASGAGMTAPPAMAAYAMAKEAMRALTRVAAVEWGRHGIRALVLCPFTETDGMSTFEAEMGLSRSTDLLPDVPLGRIGDPETDVGRVVAFLASDDANYLTGSTLMVDGGYTYMR